MFLVELVLQGVRGIRQLARLRFQGGFNIVVAGNESGKTSSVDAVLRLLFPSNRPDLLATMISHQTPDASRAALVAFSDDGGYYRVIEDFSKQGVNLSKYNAASKDFSLLYKDWDSTMQFMAGMTGGIAEDDYARLFVLRRDQYRKNAGAPAAAIVRKAVPASAPRQQSAAGTPAREARLAELREALRKSEESADADYKCQSAQLRLEETKKKLHSLDDMSQRIAELDGTLAELEGCQTLPENLTEMLDEHEQRQSQKMAKSDELNRDIRDLQAQLDSMPQANLVKDKLFFLGALVAALSFLAGVFVLTAEQAAYFPLGVVVGLVLVVIAWYKGSLKNTARRAVQKEADGLEAELHELEKSFEQGGVDIAEFMKATGAQTTAELKEKAEQYRYFLSLRNELEEQQKAALSGLRREDLLAEYDKQQQEVNDLAKAASALSKYALDTYSLRQDIERLEMEIGGTAGLGMPDLSGDFAVTAPMPPSGGDGFAGELEIASRVGAIEMETLVPAAVAAAQRNLAAVTGGKYIRIDAAQEGDPVVYANDNSVVKFSELSHGTRELLYFCLRTGIAEALAGKRRLPFILDDPFAGFDPGRQQAACQILRTLGTKTQVILLTSNPGLRVAGDAAAELK